MVFYHYYGRWYLYSNINYGGSDVTKENQICLIIVYNHILMFNKRKCGRAVPAKRRHKLQDKKRVKKIYIDCRSVMITILFL